jgi:transcriptional regulator
MYVPAAFREEGVPELHDAIRRTGLATLVTAGPKGLVATHLPLLLDPEPAPLGTLHGHIARANPQWRDLSPGAEALAIFRGPDAYVSPSWYPSKARTGKAVPTWNYVAVHAYGPVEVFDDKDRLRALVERLSDLHEGGRGLPWRLSDAPEGYVDAMLSGIVGVTIPVARIEGARKLSQNRAEEDREGVREALSASGLEGDRLLVELM